MYTPLRYLLGIAACSSLLACNGSASCSRLTGCVTVQVKQLSNDSVVFDTTRCSYSINSREFQDSLYQFTAPYTDQSRYSTAFTDSVTDRSQVTVKGKDASQWEARGYLCEFPK